MSNPVGWFEIYVNDMPRAKSFYEATLGITLSKLDNTAFDMLAFPSEMTSYGSGGALVKMDGVAAGGHGTVVYFMCKDCAVEASRVEKAGGRIQKPKTPIGPYGFIVLALDTEGNLIGLHSMA